jgi:hypothetical protein
MELQWNGRMKTMRKGIRLEMWYHTAINEAGLAAHYFFLFFLNLWGLPGYQRDSWRVFLRDYFLWNHTNLAPQTCIFPIPILSLPYHPKGPLTCILNISCKIIREHQNLQNLLNKINILLWYCMECCYFRLIWRSNYMS